MVDFGHNSGFIWAFFDEFRWIWRFLAVHRGVLVLFVVSEGSIGCHVKFSVTTWSFSSEAR